MTHICVRKLTIIGSDNGLSPGRCQAIIWTNAGILLIQTLGTNFSEILMEIYTFQFKKMHLEMSSGKCRPSCLGLNLLMSWWNQYIIWVHQAVTGSTPSDYLDQWLHSVNWIPGHKFQWHFNLITTFFIKKTLSQSQCAENIYICASWVVVHGNNFLCSVL